MHLLPLHNLLQHATVKLSYILVIFSSVVHHLPLVHEYYCIPEAIHRNFKISIFRNVDVHVVGGCLVLDWPFVSLPLPTNYLYPCAILFIYGNLIPLILLIFGFDHFLVGSKV